MEFTTTDGIKIAYTDQGVGPVIIFLAGYSGIKEEWQQQIPFFVMHNYRVITFDARNHGHSTHQPRNLKIARLGQDLAELIDYLNITQAILIGHSMGSAAIWAYCMLHGTSKIHKIVTTDESPYPLNTPEWHYGALDLTWDNLATKAPTVMETKMAQLPIDEAVKDVLRGEHQAFPFDFVENQILLRNHLSQDWRDLIVSLDIPQLYLAGGSSPLWSAEHAEVCVALAKPQLANAYIFADAGHLPQLELPNEFNQVVNDFLVRH